MSHFNKKVDLNHAQIVTDLRNKKCGIILSVLDTHALGKDAPDIIVGVFNRNYLVEIKSEKGKPTVGQLKFASNWNGAYYFAKSASEILKQIHRDFDREFPFYAEETEKLWNAFAFFDSLEYNRKGTTKS